MTCFFYPDLGDTFTDPLTSASASGDNSVATVVPVVVVLIVLGIVVIVVVIGGMVYCKRSAPRKATSESSVTHGSFKRSASRCSYASQGSRHSSRSSRSNRSRYVMRGGMGQVHVVYQIICL